MGFGAPGTEGDVIHVGGRLRVLRDAGRSRSCGDEIRAASRITGEANSWRQSTTEKQRTRVSPITWPFAIALLAVAAWEFAAWHMQSRRLLQ